MTHLLKSYEELVLNSLYQVPCISVYVLVLVDVAQIIFFAIIAELESKLPFSFSSRIYSLLVLQRVRTKTVRFEPSDSKEERFRFRLRLFSYKGVADENVPDENGNVFVFVFVFRIRNGLKELTYLKVFATVTERALLKILPLVAIGHHL